MEPSSSSSSSSKRKRDSDSFDEVISCKRPKNDVFLNYSYEDTGKSIVSHVKGGLTRNGFTISDHTMLPIGQDESSELVKAIKDSEICLVVFSSKYAFSVRRLNELVNIMDCLPKFKKRKVFPIFFNVDPSHVRSQKEGSFMEAFQEHETKINHERVQKWRQALKDAAQRAGLTFTNGMDEGKFVRDIIKSLREMKNPLELFDATHPVGIEPRVEDIISKLRLGDNVFTIVAVLGIGGSGKTTIVKAVYDRIAADFDARCFIENIHDYKNSGRNWKVHMQKKVISQLTGKRKFHNDVPAMIRRFITTRKVLLVLDNVDEFEQLRALGIHNTASFGCESRIIVTTKNKQSLSDLPYTAYEISLLNDRESFELFTKFAFGKDDPIDEKFVNEILLRAEGLPLVLEVWGRHFKCHERKQWPNVLETLKRIPHGEVQKKLQMSYDSLPDRSKKLFLDIACFFYGWEKDLVVKVLQDEDSGFFPDFEIQHLVDKSLVKIDKGGLLMHHAIREMAKEVIHQEVISRYIEYKPGQHTRLIDRKDVLDVLRDCSGTKSVEGIMLHYGDYEIQAVQVEALQKMTNLRFIKLRGFYLKWSFSFSSSNDDMPSFSLKKLKYLEWEYFPFKCLDNMDVGNIVVIKLHNSKLEKLWEGFKSLKKLRILDLSYSSSLTKTGNLAGVENLEKFRLSMCPNLEELNSSIGCLKKLKKLEVRYCPRLNGLPWEMIGKLKSLEKLDVAGCPNIMNTTLCEVGDSLCQLHKLKLINLSRCQNLTSIPNLPPNIKFIEARNCISLVNLPSNMPELQSLIELDLYGCFQLGPIGFMKVIGLRNLCHYGGSSPLAGDMHHRDDVKLTDIEGDVKLSEVEFFSSFADDFDDSDIV